MIKEVLHVAAEATPFAKVGGLADVVGSLPIALNRLNSQFRASIIIPCYQIINKQKFGLKKIKTAKIVLWKKKYPISLWQTTHQGVRVYFIENREFMGGGEIYFDKETDIKKEARRFQFFATAAAELINQKILAPAIVHCHDWHSAPLLLFANRPSIYTIHNLANQGPGKGELNYMELGIRQADIITTVSPSYHDEILTKEFGEGLEKILQSRQKDFYGILNGIDYDYFNPQTDPNIKTNYSQKSLALKKENKSALLKRVGLENNFKRLLVGAVSRLTDQKGIELAVPLFKDFPEIQWIILGTGRPKIEKILKNAAEKQSNARVIIDFDPKLAQLIYAGVDLFLMPSYFEPCGLAQMIAMHYGTLPLVRAVGGLKDTVSDLRDGFIFQKDVQIAKRLSQAKDIYLKKTNAWQKMQEKAMEKDFSWDKSARQYLNLYQKLAA